MQRNQIDIVGSRDRVRGRDGLRDLARARQEAQHITARGRQQLTQRISDAFARSVINRHRMQRARDIDDGTAAEKRLDRGGVERRGHHQDAQLGTRQPRLFCQGETEVGMHAPLVKLINDQRRDVAQQWIILQVSRKDAFGDDE